MCKICKATTKRHFIQPPNNDRVLLRCNSWKFNLHTCRRTAFDAHILQSLTHGTEGSVHIVFIERADASHTKGVGNGEFAWVQNKAFLFHCVVKILEDELRIGRHMNRNDDRRLQVIRQQGLKAHLAQAVEQDAAVVGVALVAPGDAAFRVELI